MSKTKVKFIILKGEVVALFPETKNMHYPLIMSYAHIGQHSEASPGLMRCRFAPKKDYKALEKELTQLIGYELEVLNERR